MAFTVNHHLNDSPIFPANPVCFTNAVFLEACAFIAVISRHIIIKHTKTDLICAIYFKHVFQSQPEHPASVSMTSFHWVDNDKSKSYLSVVIPRSPDRKKADKTAFIKCHKWKESRIILSPGNSFQ